MSGTHVFYNGVLMRDCDLKEFDQVIEKDDSNTDHLYNRFRFTFASRLVSLHSVNPQVGPPLDLNEDENNLQRQHLSTIAIPFVDGESVIDRVKYIERQLQEPRKDFWLALNAVTNKSLAENTAGEFTPADNPFANDSYRIVLAATGIHKPETEGNESMGFVTGPLPGSPTEVERNKVLDVNNGPHPIDVKVQRIHGGRAMEVVFSIEVCRLLCEEGDPYAGDDPEDVAPVRDASKVKGVISNRWSLTDAMDANWETQHTINGTLRVSDQRYKPMALRLVVTPKLFPYAHLNNQEFAVDKTGLVLQYQFTIKETGYAPPPGVVKWSGSYTEITAINNSQRIADLEVTVRAAHTGPAGWNRNEAMLVALHDIARSRIEGLNILAPFNVGGGNQPEQPLVKAILQKVSITEVLGQPERKLTATVTYVDADMSMWKLRVNQMGSVMTIPDYDSRFWPVPRSFQWSDHTADERDFGSYFEGYYQTPCSEWHGMPRGYEHPEAPDKDDIGGREEPEFFVAYALGDVNPAVGLNHSPAVQGLNHSWSESQLSDSTYLAWDADDTYRTNQGMLHLPLSKIRQGETAIVIPIHAGIQNRVLTMVATRLKQPPEIPRPAPVLTDSITGLTEKLLSQTLVAQAVELQADGVTQLHGLKIEYVYGLNRPVGSAGMSSDKYRRPSSPKDLSSPSAVALSPLNIETDNRIELS